MNGLSTFALRFSRLLTPGSRLLYRLWPRFRAYKFHRLLSHCQLLKYLCPLPGAIMKANAIMLPLPAASFSVNPPSYCFLSLSSLRYNSIGQKRERKNEKKLENWKLRKVFGNCVINNKQNGSEWKAIFAWIEDVGVASRKRVNKRRLRKC